MTKAHRNIAAIWSLATQDFAAALGTEQSLLFLGALLLRPFRDQLNESIFGGKFIPGIWIHGPQACGKTVLANAASRFFYEGSEEAPRLFARDVKEPRFINALLRQGIGSHFIIEEWADLRMRHNEQKFAALRAAFDGSEILNEQSHAVSVPSPLAIIAFEPCPEVALASRVFHFRPHTGLNFRGSDLYHRFTDHLTEQADTFVATVKGLIEAADKRIAPPGGDGRQTRLLRMAWASIVAADHALGGENPPGKMLQRWINSSSATLFPRFVEA